MKNCITIALETHLFFGRIMKEHALFLEAGFPAKETDYINKGKWFREQFEEALEAAVALSNGAVSEEVLASGEIVTEFTEKAECQTNKLTGIPINRSITKAEKNLRAGRVNTPSREFTCRVRQLNQRVVSLLNGFIDFKERILKNVDSCNLFTANYPLLIEHILREARLYRQIITQLGRKGSMSYEDMRATELFWNQIMMEHAQFIRGLLDPTECQLMETADEFADDYCRLLEEANSQDCRAWDEMTKAALETTREYVEFKTAGAKGITDCKIRSILLPLLADHVLREANHYLRILETPVQS